MNECLFWVKSWFCAMTECLFWGKSWFCAMTECLFSSPLVSYSNDVVSVVVSVVVVR
jgi:hypothetical protein